LDFQSRSNLKWTWGVDLEIEDLQDLMGSRYHGRLKQSHSGYDTDLSDGSVTGSHSDYPGPLPQRPVFDELSSDIKEPSELALVDIPHIFQHHPLQQTGIQGTAISKILEHRMADHGLRQGRKTVLLPVVPMPDMTSFTVPSPPAVVDTRRADKVPVGMDSNCTPSALRAMDIGGITFPSIGNVTPVQWIGFPVPLDSIGHPTPDLSPGGSNFPSSPMTEWVNRGWRVNIFSDDDMEVDALTERSLAGDETHDKNQVMHAGSTNIHENAAVIDVDTLADAWDSPTKDPLEKTAPHSGTMIDANVLADAWSFSDEEGPAGIDVEALAAAWDSEGSASTGQAVKLLALRCERVITRLGRTQVLSNKSDQSLVGKLDKYSV